MDKPQLIFHSGANLCLINKFTVLWGNASQPRYSLKFSSLKIFEEQGEGKTLSLQDELYGKVPKGILIKKAGEYCFWKTKMEDD